MVGLIEVLMTVFGQHMPVFTRLPASRDQPLNPAQISEILNSTGNKSLHHKQMVLGIFYISLVRLKSRLGVLCLVMVYFNTLWIKLMQWCMHSVSVFC